jgi:hypothetical protein
MTSVTFTAQVFGAARRRGEKTVGGVLYQPETIEVQWKRYTLQETGTWGPWRPSPVRLSGPQITVEGTLAKRASYEIFTALTIKGGPQYVRDFLAMAQPDGDIDNVDEVAVQT